MITIIGIEKIKIMITIIGMEKIKVVINVKKRTKEKNKMRLETQKLKISGNYDSVSVFRRFSTLLKDIIHTLLAFLIA